MPALLDRRVVRDERIHLALALSGAIAREDAEEQHRLLRQMNRLDAYLRGANARG